MSSLFPDQCSSFVRAIRPFLRPGLRVFRGIRLDDSCCGEWGKRAYSMESSGFGLPVTHVALSSAHLQYDLSTSRFGSRARGCWLGEKIGPAAGARRVA